MKHLTLATVITALTLAATGSLARAANVDVQWQDPANFRDVRATNEGAEHFRERVMNEIAQAFQDGAHQLPEGQTLHVDIKDVDLAGEVEFFHENYPFGLRVMRRVDAPALTFSYELRDANDQVVKSGEEKLRDLNYNYVASRIKPDRVPLKYEKELIHAWVQNNFQQQQQ